jgi:hypothetical protein
MKDYKSLEDQLFMQAYLDRIKKVKSNDFGHWTEEEFR